MLSPSSAPTAGTVRRRTRRGASRSPPFLFLLPLFLFATPASATATTGEPCFFAPYEARAIDSDAGGRTYTYRVFPNGSYTCTDEHGSLFQSGASVRNETASDGACLLSAKVEGTDKVLRQRMYRNEMFQSWDVCYTIADKTHAAFPKRCDPTSATLSFATYIDL